MDWDELRYVLAVTRDRSLQRAAASLGVAHTTVGRRLKSLEDQLGVRLFDGWDGGENWRWFEGWLAENAPGAKIALRLEYKGLLVAHAVRAWIGAQILPCFLADPDPLLHRLTPLDDT